MFQTAEGKVKTILMTVPVGNGETHISVVDLMRRHIAKVIGAAPGNPADAERFHIVSGGGTSPATSWTFQVAAPDHLIDCYLARTAPDPLDERA